MSRGGLLRNKRGQLECGLPPVPVTPKQDTGGGQVSQVSRQPGGQVVTPEAPLGFGNTVGRKEGQRRGSGAGQELPTASGSCTGWAMLAGQSPHWAGSPGTRMAVHSHIWEGCRGPRVLTTDLLLLPVALWAGAPSLRPLVGGPPLSQLFCSR